MYNLEINLLDGRSFTVECKTRNNVAINAKLIRNNGFTDNSGKIYTPSQIQSTVCPELITPNKRH